MSKRDNSDMMIQDKTLSELIEKEYCQHENMIRVFYVNREDAVVLEKQNLFTQHVLSDGRLVKCCWYHDHEFEYGYYKFLVEHISEE